jgi:hypothetical protein
VCVGILEFFGWCLDCVFWYLVIKVEARVGNFDTTCKLDMKL